METLYRTRVKPVLLRSSADAAPSSPLTAALHRVPKLDFHCHLNGSISAPLLAHLERLLHLRHGGADGAASALVGTDSGSSACDEAGHILFFNSQEKRAQNVLTASPTSASGGEAGSDATPAERMHYCFTVFEAIYKVLTNLAFTRLAVQDMLITSAAENIFVMEIRTSMRDGMRRGFRAPAAGGDDEDGAVVTKQMYVDTVVETVQHVLAGGLVDFATGELMPAEASAAVLSAGAELPVAEASAAATASAWWRVYERVYRTLLQPPPPHRAGPASTEADDFSTALRRHFVEYIQPNLTQRMHVRLLLSVNRGAPVTAAWEAARLTTVTQQRQAKEFHAWCCTHVPVSLEASADGASDASADAAHLMACRLRATCWVTGMDFSGNCYKGRYAELEPALAAARAGARGVADEDISSSSSATNGAAVEGGRHAGGAESVHMCAAITIHAGEKQDAGELSAMIDFAPERWGHLVFTDPVNLARILAAQQGIELCLTSNLLTGGHSDVVDHHLGDLLQLWAAMPESHTRDACRGDDGAAVRGSYPCYAATERARLLHRQARAARRWGGGPPSSPAVDQGAAAAAAGAAAALTTGDGSADAPSTYVLPNISFHTDDRGVFGTTLSQELLLAATHPSIGELCTVLWQQQRVSDAPPSSSTDADAALAHFFWMLERLALLQVFELPVPVQLIAAAVLHDAAASPESASARELLMATDTWRDWPSYVRLCNSLTTAPAAAGVAAQLSRWEWAWLTACFDRYYA